MLLTRILSAGFAVTLHFGCANGIPTLFTVAPSLAIFTDAPSSDIVDRSSLANTPSSSSSSSSSFDHELSTTHTTTRQVNMTSLSEALLELLNTIEGESKTEKRDIVVALSTTVTDNAATLDSLSSRAKSASSAAIRASLTCAAIRLLFGSAVVLEPHDSTYISTKEYNWNEQCWLPASCFIKITSKVQLAVVLKTITCLQSKFAVRSGGHNANVGFGSVDTEGVLLDLSPLNSVVVSADKKYASVGPGAKWEGVYTSLEAQKLTVIGGRVSDVGVGGLVLGGGMSHFTTKYGTVSDNVKNFEVVLADSRIVNANAQTNPDLFKALKGGGANFGIVTNYDLHTYPDYQVWYTFKVYSGADSAAVLAAAVAVQKNMETNPALGFFLNDNGGMFIAGMVHLGWADEQPAGYDPFDAITPLAVAIPPTNGTALSVAVAANTPGIANRITGGISINTDTDLYQKINTVYQNVLASTTTSATFSLAFTFQPVTVAAQTAFAKNGGNSMNIPSVSQSWLACIVQWTDPAEEALANNLFTQMVNGISAAAKSSGNLLDFQFMNDAGPLENPLKSYGTASESKLRAVALKYDPTQVFQKLQSNGYLLSKI